jgi:N-acyl-D-amino-acid deacylase
MRAHVEEAMTAEAIGLSSGTFYPPAMQATTEEIIEVSRPLSARNALYVTHMRDESDRVIEALEETLQYLRARPDVEPVNQDASRISSAS